jgi:hypothetical protein
VISQRPTSRAAADAKQGTWSVCCEDTQADSVQASSRPVFLIVIYSS